MTLSDSLKASAAMVAAALGMALALAQLSPGPPAPAGHVRVGSAPVGSVGVWSTVLASPEAAAAWGVDAGGVSVYARVRVCALDVDGGMDPGPLALPGLYILYDDDTTSPCQVTDPQLEAWVQGRSDAPFACACSPGPACLGADGGAAPQGVTLTTWSGTCLPKSCVELSGVSSWPIGCPGGG